MYERIHMIDQMLAVRKFVPFSELQDRLMVSRATLNRDIAFMRDRLNAPIVFDRELSGYRFEQDSKLQTTNMNFLAYGSLQKKFMRYLQCSIYYLI